MKATSLLVLAPLLIHLSVVHAEETKADEKELEQITIIGSTENASQITGSAHYIGPEDLAEFHYSDIQRIIREVPGVSVQLEDGYGLRPNISIRGVASERSGRITLLEDNVLIAPAPYSAPSAYYFPTAGRMSAVEVVKGPASITQGPYTIGGVLNMSSTPIPDQQQGNLIVEAGTDATYRVHASFGGSNDSGFGYLLETHQWQSDGFQDIDRSDNDTGLDIQDYTLKLAYAPANSAHSLSLKLQSAKQNSNQSYLGLTDADFDNDSLRRYGLSALDTISTDHEQIILRYQFKASPDLKLSATAYNNTHERNWFKTEGIDLNGSVSAQDFDRTSWSNVILAVNTGSSLSRDNDNFSAAELQAILDGTLDTAAGSLQLRSNAREYYSRGLQLGLDWSTTIGSSSHSFEAGIRYHEDEEDRLQRNSSYQQLGGELILNDLGELGNAGNRVQQAEAIALHIYDRIEFGQWTLTPGLRYEAIDQQRTRYNDGAQRTFRDSRNNKTTVLLPGIGVLFAVNDTLGIVAGAHKGFTAPSNSPGVREEEAINFEFGFRFQDGDLQAEAIVFISDYDNLLGECTSSSGNDCEIGEAFNGDAATVRGLEVVLSHDLAHTVDYRLPLSLNYTYIDAQFDTDIADTDFFGNVSNGDPIPYIPENQLQLSAGLEMNNWSAFANLNYVDEVCTMASCAAFEVTDSLLTLDISGRYQLNDSLSLFARAENLTGDDGIVARQPYGARPAKDTSVTLGFALTF